MTAAQVEPMYPEKDLSKNTYAEGLWFIIAQTRLFLDTYFWVLSFEVQTT
jgi:hypothetical protein